MNSAICVEALGIRETTDVEIPNNFIKFNQFSKFPKFGQFNELRYKEMKKKGFKDKLEYNTNNLASTNSNSS